MNVFLPILMFSSLGYTAFGQAHAAPFRLDSVVRMARVSDCEQSDSDSADADECAPAAAGSIARLDLLRLKHINAQVGDLLSKAPDDVTGKRSAWFSKISQWKSSFDLVVLNGSQVGAFQMIPQMAEFFDRDQAGEASPFLANVEFLMNDCGSYLIRAAALHIVQHGGVVDAAVVKEFVQLFAVRGFKMESDWEETPMPLDSGGVMILDPIKVVSQLEALPWAHADFFLGGQVKPTDVFSKYSSSGNGLSILRRRYLQNQQAIDGKLAELVAWETKQEQQSQSAQ